MENKDSESKKQDTTAPEANTDPNTIGEPKTSPTPTAPSSKPTLRVSRYFKGQLPKDHPLRKGYLLLQPLTKDSSTNTPTKLSVEGKNLPPPVDPSPDKPQ